MSFVHLHTHSHYSLLDGVPKIPELIDRVKQLKMPAIALTDHGNLYGAIEFYQQAKKRGVKPIIGVEAYLAPSSMHERTPKERPFHIVLLAENNTGYENLIKLVTTSHLEGFYQKPRIDLDLLQQHSDGLIALSACLAGEIPRTILTKGYEDAVEVVKKYLNIFDTDHFYLEVQHKPSTPEQQQVNDVLLQLHNDLGVKLVATNDTHYIDPSDNEAQDVLVCIQTKQLLSEENRLSMRNEDYSLRPPQEMQELFSAYPGAIQNTIEIAERVQVDLEFGKIQMPYYHLPEGATPEQELRTLCENGLQKRYGNITDEVQKRLEYELEIINKTGFASYFLIVQDFINWAKEKGVAVGPGRGSAAGSLVSFLTNITDIDPIKYQLLFERFLNPERVSQPDIDTDFADIRRDDVLRYVEEKYGKDHVAQIITFGTMAARAVVRDVGRVLGLSYGYCDRIAKLIPMFTSLEQALKTVPELSEIIDNDPDAERLMTIARKLEGVVRHTSTHACAVVITKDPLTTTVPLQYVDQEDKTIVTQYSMNPIESLGLLKMDFLGLKNLTIIENTLDVVQATTNTEISIEDIPLNDKKTYALLKQANTIGVFQLESSGMRRYLKQLKPTEFEDIIAMVALYRPGPMEFIPEYIQGKHGKRTITYLDKRLKPILEKTYGIAVYQEQVAEIARQLANFSYGEADVLRKAVGKKIKSLLDEQGQKLISGMIQNGISQSVAQKIWNFILPFARYGFNRSHAACYAMIAYRTAYLKANYPAQFMAALMTSDDENTDRIAIEVNHAEQMGLTVLPPDINESFADFSVVKDSLEEESPRIRFGLRAVKNVGDHIVDVIIKERKQNGPYKSMEDLLTRVQDKDLNKKSLESLIKCGACDAFTERNTLLMNIESLLHFSKRTQEEKRSGQGNLFGSVQGLQAPALRLAEAPPVTDQEQLSWEKELLGLYISGHPLADYRTTLERDSIPFETLKKHPKGRVVTLIGMVTTIKRVTTKNGEMMLFAGFADHTSEIEALVFPKVVQQYSTFWQEDALLKVRGKLDDKDGSIKILVEEVERWKPISEKKVIITVPTEIKKTVFEEFQQLLKESEGEYAVELHSDEKQIDTRQKIDQQTIEKVEKIFGQQNVDVIH